MIKLRRSKERGHANHGWLDTYHTFSFADFHDPEFMGFSELRVINQDRVAAGRGFGTHGHRDMEIVSYVLDGVLEHKDSMGNGSQMRPGDVQIMSAGSGVEHSEFNGSAEESLHFLQMWVYPRTPGTRPRYGQKHFAAEARTNQLCLVVSTDGANGSLQIDQDAKLYVSLLSSGRNIVHELDPQRAMWIHVARGSVDVNGQRLDPGDGAALEGESVLELAGHTDAEFVVWDLPGV